MDGLLNVCIRKVLCGVTSMCVLHKLQVLSVIEFETEAEAIALANDTEYGLANAVFTNDRERSVRACADS